MTGQFIFEHGRLAQQIRYIAPKLPHLTKPKKTRSRRTALKFDTTIPPMIDVVFFTGDQMPDEPKPEGAPAGPEKPAEGEKPAAPLPKPAAARCRQACCSAAAKPAAPAAHAAPKPPAPMAVTPLGKRSYGPSPRTFRRRRSPNFPPTSARISWLPNPTPSSPILEFLKLEQDFDYLVDLTAVDYPKRAGALRRRLHSL